MRGALCDAQNNTEKLYGDIEHARKLYGYTQEQAGGFIGVGQPGYSKRIAQKTLNVSELCYLAEAYGFEVRLCAKF